MDSKPLLAEIARALNECKLEAILVGNAAAVLRGAPLTTLDFDFFFRKTPENLQKLKSLAKLLKAHAHSPFYPASGTYRVERKDELLLQIDFMSVLHGIRSFEGVRSRAERVDFDGNEILVADLRDIIKSKKAAGRPRDLAVLEILERVAEKTQKAEADPGRATSRAQGRDRS